ncbi:hypothetical protein SRHO_G00106910 [Serrasalmus rhombeus]
MSCVSFSAQDSAEQTLPPKASLNRCAGMVSRVWEMESPQQSCVKPDVSLEIMKAGSVLRKAKSRMWRGHRHYKLQDDCKTIAYKSSWAMNSYSTFSVGDVEAVREGHESDVFLSVADEYPPERCFTLVFRGRRGNLDLVAESAEEAQAWIRGMQTLIENLQSMGESEKLDQMETFFKVIQAILKAKTNHTMSIDGFLMYLTSADGSIFNSEDQRLYQDMTQPLKHYFISSSHNTYLLEDQLKGRSSVEGYIQALKRGCRCLEIDCWDGSSGEPVVYHGHTFTSKILFKDVINTVAKYAFKTSEYPVILSIENRCSVEQQKVMAQLLKDILGDMLLRTTIDGKVPSVLPSPEELKGKILVKGKKIGGLESLDADNPVSGEVSDEEDSSELRRDSLTTESLPSDSKKSKQSLTKELSDLVIYCKNEHFNNFEHARIHGKPYDISSFSESKARKIIKEAAADFAQHNARQITRVYPSGLRTDSSNFCPQDMWNVGCQMVALNFQTAGLEMDLNDGLFSQNNRCGYVLKPEILRNSEQQFNPDKPQDRKDYCPLILTIQVISGQQLPKVNNKVGSIVDPFVRVEIYGVPPDQATQETSYIENNGLNPCWNETLEFAVHTPELALIRFVVEDYDMATKNDFIGQYTVPFSCIQSGYRHIHLLSKDGTSLRPSSLFVNINITEAS